MLKRLFRLIDEAPAAPLDAQSFIRLCQEEPEQAKKQLLQAYRALLEEYEEVMEPLQQKVQLAVDRLRRTQAPLLEHELHQFYREEQAIRRVCTRILLAQEETQVLLGEWHDWLRHAHGGMKVTEFIRERMELLRSELTVRGVAIKLPVFAPMSIASVESKPTSSSSVAVGAKLPIRKIERTESPPVQEEDEFIVWRTHALARKQKQKERLQHVFHALLQGHALSDTKEAMLLVKKYKKAHE